VAAPLRVQVLAPPEHDRDLDLRALIQEAHDVALLRLVVVNADLRPELDLLDVDLLLVPAGELGLLLLFVLVLPVVHDPRDGRIGVRCDLDEVESLAVRVVAHLIRGLHSQLRSVLVDEPNARNANVLVDPVLRLGPRPVLWTTTRSQRPLTKLTG